MQSTGDLRLHGGRVWMSWAFLALTIPWLTPFSSGPSPAVVPWLVTALCVGVLLLCPWRIDTNTIVRAWLAAALVSSLIAGIQYFGLSHAAEPWINRADKGTAFANLRQRNQFATLTSLGLAALWWCMVTRGLTATRISKSIVGLAALLAIGNAASSSRTGLVELLLLVPLLGRYGKRERGAQIILWAAAISYAAGVVFLPVLAGLDPGSHGIFARFSEDGPSCASRMVLWRNVLDLIAQRPWLGWGWGELDYAHYISLYSGPRFCDILDNAHNLPLHLAVELGLPAATLICGGLLWFVVRAQPWRETDPTRQLAWAVFAVIGLHNLLEYPLWYGPFQMASGLCIVLLWRSSNCSNSPPRLAHRSVAIMLAGLLLSACVYSAWDYHRISQIYLAPEQRADSYRDNTLEKIRGSWLFHRQVQFAELTTTPLTPSNAAQINRMADELLHFSPEPRVIEKLIESAVMLGRDDEARFHIARYRAAFPAAHAKWAAAFAGAR